MKIIEFYQDSAKPSKRNMFLMKEKRNTGRKTLFFEGKKEVIERVISRVKEKKIEKMEGANSSI